MNQENQNNSAPSNLPTGDNGGSDNIRKDSGSVSAPETSTHTEKKSEEDKKGTAVKAAAIIGVIILIFVGLYATSRVVANIPDFARGLASGFVSVTSELFTADDEDEDENENADIDEEEDTDNRSAEGEEDGDEEGDREGKSDGSGEIDGGSAETPAPQPQTPGNFRVVEIPGQEVESDPNGDVDLKVSLIALGRSDNLRGDDFRETDEFDEDDFITIKFEVRNIGTKTSDQWEYEVELPTRNSFTFESDEQDELRPGDRMEFTLTFEDADEDEDEIVIEVDPDDDTDDVNRRNNRLRVELEIER